MNNDMLSYYERELAFIHAAGEEFAKEYPKIAGRLSLAGGRSEDPHTERIIDAFGMLSGRIYKKLNDSFPQIAEAFLNTIYPHYIRPVPSMSIVKFEAVNTLSPSGFAIEKNTSLFSKPVNGAPCRFATAFPVTLWPVDVVYAGIQNVRRVRQGIQQVIVVRLKSRNNIPLSQLPWESLRFFLKGAGQHVHHLYELLFNNVHHVECAWLNDRKTEQSLPLKPENIAPVGFGPDENVIPRPPRSFPGYTLLLEYFSFPEKFLFFDLKGLGRLRNFNVPDTMEIRIYIDQPVKPGLVINADSFCLHAVPVINLFQCIAEPISMEHRKTEYQVLPDVTRADFVEVFSIDKVTFSAAVNSGVDLEFHPFYDVPSHALRNRQTAEEAFWYEERRPSERGDDAGTEVFLSFADNDFILAEPEAKTVTVYITCSNRDLPARLPFGDKAGDFEMRASSPVHSIVCLLKPTPAHRPSLRRTLQWLMVSHLAMNYLSAVGNEEKTLKEILSIYDFDDSPVTRQQINGIVSLSSQFVTKRIGQSFCRGVETTIEFDETKYVGSGVYLFSSVLERFLSQYVSVNSFSQLKAKTVQRKELLKIWPARNGNRVLL